MLVLRERAIDEDGGGRAYRAKYRVFCEPYSITSQVIE